MKEQDISFPIKTNIRVNTGLNNHLKEARNIEDDLFESKYNYYLSDGAQTLTDSSIENPEHLSEKEEKNTLESKVIKSSKDNQDNYSICNHPEITLKENSFKNYNINTNEEQEEIKFNTGRWSGEEHQQFIEAMFLYGNEWKRVQQHIKTRSSTQARSHAQKFFIKLRKKFLEENADDDMDTEAKCNEMIINWIKETISPELVEKLNGNLNEENLFDFKLSDEAFSEKKNRLCKLIMNLIDNSTKNKKHIHRNKLLDLPNDIKHNLSMSNSNTSISGNKNENKQTQLNNYYNPNLNNYINIVTINLCNQNQVPNQSMLNINSIPSDEKNTLLNKKRDNSDYKKLLFMEYQKMLHTKKPNFNEENENKLDPFKLNFDNMDEFNINVDDDTNKFNLDLGHFFNDNYLN